jgi:hypothetical protein
MKVNGKELSSDQIARRLGRQYEKLEAHWANDRCAHPSKIPAGDWAKTLSTCAAATAANDEDESDVNPDRPPQSAQARLHAHDGAPRNGVPMTEAFPGFTQTGDLRPNKPNTGRWGCGDE